MTSQIYFGDNLNILIGQPDESVSLIYIDPPFNTGKVQARRSLKTRRAENGDRVGFGNHSYQSEVVSEQAYRDFFVDYEAFLLPRLEQSHRLLKPNGSLYFHIDYREVHYCKIMLDQIFGRENFLNEIIWAYDYGGRAKDRWPAKHDNILFYVKDYHNYVFNRDDIDRIPYMAPGLVSKEKAEKGKLPTDTWWHTIVGTNSREKTGYPTQKPVAILERIIRASSNPGDQVLDFFAGSGTTGQACLNLDRRFILIDNNPQAIEVMRKRFADEQDIEWIGEIAR
ncbi:MAG: site-specific DNA-methyltransferase [Anaerolineaceae bacterium]